PRLGCGPPLYARDRKLVGVLGHRGERPTRELDPPAASHDQAPGRAGGAGVDAGRCGAAIDLKVIWPVTSASPARREDRKAPERARSCARKSGSLSATCTTKAEMNIHAP